jgi:hypothetical protein
LVFKGGVDDVKVDQCAHGAAIAPGIDGLHYNALTIVTTQRHDNPAERSHNPA